jgi:hypothetical protein
MQSYFFCSQFQSRHSCAPRTSAKQNISVTAYLFPSDQRPHYFETPVLSRKKMPCDAVFSDPEESLPPWQDTDDSTKRPNTSQAATTSLTPSIIERVVCALLGFSSAISAASFIDSQLSRQRQLSQSIFIITAGRSEHPRTCRFCKLNLKRSDNSGGPWIRSVFAAEH